VIDDNRSIHEDFRKILGTRSSERPHTAETEWLFSPASARSAEAGETFQEVFRGEGIQGMPSPLGRV